MKHVLCIKYYVVCIKIFIVFIILNTCYLILATAPVEASALSLSINPPIIEINALPPANVRSNLTIKNKSDNEVSLKIELRPFKAKGENGELEYDNSQEPFLVKNVQVLDNGIAISSLTLGPSQEKNLTLNINIAQNTNMRDYYFSIVFISDNTSSPTSSSALNQLGIASNILLSVGQKEIPNAFLEEFSSGLFFEKGPVPFTIRINNKGVHFINPKGEIVIKNMFGQTIGRLDLLSINVLSDSIRAFPKALWKEDFLLGFYTATLNMSLSSDVPSFTKSIHFFAFPLEGLIIIVIAAIVIIIIRNRVKTYIK